MTKKDAVRVYPTGIATVEGEPDIPHDVTPERAKELTEAPYPAFSLTPASEAPATPEPPED